MSRLVFGHDEAIAKWVFEKMGGVSVFPHQCLGMTDKSGALKGAFLISFFNEHTADLTVYSEGVISNAHVREMFVHVFDGLGLTRLQIRTPRTNKAIKRAAPKYGFKFEGVQRSFWGPNEDALCFYMTREHCRWINGQSLQKTKSA